MTYARSKGPSRATLGLRLNQNGLMLNLVKSSLFCPTGVLTSREDMYTTMCTIEADLSELCKSLKPRTAFDTILGKEITFYIADFEIALLFGMTEFKALAVWKDKDVSRLRQ